MAAIQQCEYEVSLSLVLLLHGHGRKSAENSSHVASRFSDRLNASDFFHILFSTLWAVKKKQIESYDSKGIFRHNKFAFVKGRKSEKWKTVNKIACKQRTWHRKGAIEWNSLGEPMIIILLFIFLSIGIFSFWVFLSLNAETFQLLWIYYLLWNSQFVYAQISVCRHFFLWNDEVK